MKQLFCDTFNEWWRSSIPNLFDLIFYKILHFDCSPIVVRYSKSCGVVYPHTEVCVLKSKLFFGAWGDNCYH